MLPVAAYDKMNGWMDEWVKMDARTEEHIVDERDTLTLHI